MQDNIPLLELVYKLVDSGFPDFRKTVLPGRRQALSSTLTYFHYMPTPAKVVVSNNGPYLVSGGLPLREENIVSTAAGYPLSWKAGKTYETRESYSLCRCGKSKKAPFCDASHVKMDFDGTETADRRKFSSVAKKIAGPDLDLYDREDLCVGAGFCDRLGGTWNLTQKSDDPAKKATAIQQSCDCPSGRLVAADKGTGQPIEPAFEPSIGLVEDPVSGVHGPIWLKGGVVLESGDGTPYETRNRVTVCRCGKSKNRPFCDGSHHR